MKELKLKLTVAALSLGLTFSLGAAAESLSSDSYRAGKDKIAADYKSANAPCQTMSGNAKDICMAEAKGKEKVARAELEATYKPNVNNRYEVSVAKADAKAQREMANAEEKAAEARDKSAKR
jgi:hypothetical protein